MNLQSLDIFTKLAVNMTELAGAANKVLAMGLCIDATLPRSSNWMRAVPPSLDRNNFAELFPVIISSLLCLFCVFWEQAETLAVNHESRTRLKMLKTRNSRTAIPLLLPQTALANPFCTAKRKQLGS